MTNSASASAKPIVDAVAAAWGLSASELCGPSRDARTSEARQSAMWLLYQQQALTLCQISAALGRRDHTTARYAVRRIEERRSADAALRRRLADAQARLSKEESMAEHLEQIAAALIAALSSGARLTLEQRGEQVVATVSQPGIERPVQTFAGPLVRVLAHVAEWAEKQEHAA